MRENRLSGSEGGGTEANQFLLPLSGARKTLTNAQPASLRAMVIHYAMKRNSAEETCLI
jgi:hypothetical protein